MNSVARLCALSFVCCTLAGQQPASGVLGIFHETADIGTTKPGAVTFDAATGNYRVTGGGADLWGKEDDFRFLWLPVSGDATLEANVMFPADDVVPKEKAMLIFRQSTKPDAAYADLAIHGDGHIALQFRKTDGGQTEDSTATQHGSKRLRIERQGAHFTAWLGDSASSMTQVLSTDVVMHGPVLVGLGVCSHNADGVNTAIFSDVKLIRTAKPVTQAHR